MAYKKTERVKTLGDVRYCLQLYYGGTYREFEMGTDSPSEMFFGTTKNCVFRLPSELFFSDFEVALSRNENGIWKVYGGDNNYLSDNSTLKLRTIELYHGSKFSVHYQNGDAEICHGEFLRSFSAENSEYSCYIDISSLSQIDIGGNTACQIQIRDEAVGNDYATFAKTSGGWCIYDHNSRYGVSVNGTRINSSANLYDFDFFAIAGHSFFLKGNRLYMCNDPLIQAVGLRILEHTDSKSSMKYPHLNKGTRMYYSIPTEEVEYIDPPEKIKEKKQNLFVMILPSLASVILMVFLRGAMGGGMAFVMISAGSMVIGIGTSIYTYFSQKKQSAEDEEKRVETYTEYAKKKEEEIVKIRNEELLLMEYNTPDLGATVQSVWDFDGRIYERNVNDEDYLSVRIGTGPVESKRPIKFSKMERLSIEDEMVTWPETVSKKYEYLPQAPILLRLKEASMVGIVGNDVQVFEHLKMIIVDLCVRHSPLDIQLGVFISKNDISKWEWVKWFPHINNDDTGLRNIAYDEDSYKVLAENLFKVFSDREGISEDKRRKGLIGKHYVIIVTEPYDILTHPISRFFENGKDYGITFIFCNESRELLPNCNQIILLGNDSNKLIDSQKAEKIQNYTSFVIQDNTIKRLAEKLACVSIDEISLANSLTKNITLFHLLGIYKAEDLDLSGRWRESEVYKSMAVPLGVDSKNDIVYLDLHEKAHGPHGLVAGTTGSGKSEIMQSYILSIATLFHPYDVSFLIIDFKGGGMVNQFRELPHLLGAITNIDGKAINRSLKSIKAELQKRQRLFAEADVNRIDLYIKKYKAGEVNEPLPHLIIIVDEFAELKAEQPDFMKELISTARIGRSLGVHLILATQKPAGQVDDQIWSNSKFKLCLKVQGPEDSNEVIKSPLAAEIKEPGRAYLQVGNNEIFMLFQSAYSGAMERDVESNGKSFSIFQMDLSGKRTEIYKEKQNSISKDGRTQLDAIVDYVHYYCEHNNIRKLPDICLPALESIINYQEDLSCKNGLVDIGIYDDPDNQFQGSTWVDIFNKNTLIIGSSQYGKTNLLQLMIREIVTLYSSQEVNIFILDFASMFLKNFESLKHVGGVVCASDDEKFRNLIKILAEEIIVRREKLVSAGVSSFSAYCEAGFTDLPHIFVFVDNMTALFELYLNEDDVFLEIVREGIAVGISCIVANTQTNGFGYRYLSNFSNKIALFCNESSEYSNLFSRPATKPDDVVGRVILELDKRLVECQTYLAFEGEKEIDRSNNIKDFIGRINEKNQTKSRLIPYIPNVLEEDVFVDGYRPKVNNYVIPIGLSYRNVEPFYIDFKQFHILGVCGKEGRGHFNFISLLLGMLYKNRKSARVWIIDSVERKYKNFEKMEIVEQYSINPDGILAVINTMYDILSKRYEEMYQDTKRENALLLLIINNNDAARILSDDRDVIDKYRIIMDKYKNLNVSIIFANYPNQVLAYDAPEPLQLIKRERKLLFLDELSNLKVIDVPYAYIKEYRKRMQQGDAFLINDDIIEKIKIVKSS